MTSLRQFLPYILPRVAGCPDFTAIFEARNAAIVLCETARLWRGRVEMDIAANDTAIELPLGAAVHEIEAAHLDGQKLLPAPFNVAIDEAIRDAGGATRAKWVSCPTPDTVSVWPFVAGHLVLDLFLKPRQGAAASPTLPFTDDNDVVPDWMLTHHARDIADGALARILSMPSQPWTSLELAAVHGAQFEARCNSLAVRALRGAQRAPLRTKPMWI